MGQEKVLWFHPNDFHCQRSNPSNHLCDDAHWPIIYLIVLWENYVSFFKVRLSSLPLVTKLQCLEVFTLPPVPKRVCQVLNCLHSSLKRSASSKLPGGGGGTEPVLRVWIIARERRRGNSGSDDTGMGGLAFKDCSHLSLECRQNLMCQLRLQHAVQNVNKVHMVHIASITSLLIATEHMHENITAHRLEFGNCSPCVAGDNVPLSKDIKTYIGEGNDDGVSLIHTFTVQDMVIGRFTWPCYVHRHRISLTGCGYILKQPWYLCSRWYCRMWCPSMQKS